MTGNPLEVADQSSNEEDLIERAARKIGKGARRKVFEAIYYHKQKIKTASEVKEITKLSRMRVLQEGRALCQARIARSEKVDREPAYGIYDFYQANKARILRLIENPKARKAMATKRRPVVSVTVKVKGGANGGAGRPKTKELTIDQIDSFKKVRRIKADGNLPKSVSETAFKLGVQSILGDVGEWKDWGGENYDFSTTRLTYKGNRIRTVFAFKGPGYPGALAPSRMGANGDQVGRMFYEDARLYIVQHWREIKPAMWTDVKAHAVTKSDATGDTVFYLIMEGVDSHRLYRAYPDAFAAGARAEARAKKRTRKAVSRRA